MTKTPKPGAKAKTADKSGQSKKGRQTRRRSPDLIAAKKAEIIRKIARECSTIELAAISCGVARSTLYEWRDADPAFKQALVDAYEDGTQRIRAEIVRRGVKGISEPVIYQGRRALDEKGKPLNVRRYSDTLLIFEAKRRDPAYRETLPEKPAEGAPVLRPGEIVLNLDALPDGLRTAFRAFLESEARKAGPAPVMGRA